MSTMAKEEEPFVLLLGAAYGTKAITIDVFQQMFGEVECELYQLPDGGNGGHPDALKALLECPNLRSVVMNKFQFEKDAEGRIVLDDFGLLLRDWVKQGGKLVYLDQHHLCLDAMTIVNRFFFADNRQWKRTAPVSGHYDLSRSGKDVLMVNADDDGDDIVEYAFALNSTSNIKVLDEDDALMVTDPIPVDVFFKENYTTTVTFDTLVAQHKEHAQVCKRQKKNTPFAMRRLEGGGSVVFIGFEPGTDEDKATVRAVVTGQPLRPRRTSPEKRFFVCRT